MRIVIIGNGIAGITAAFRLRRTRPDWPITVVSGESDFHYSRPALMYIFMGHMRFEDTKPFGDHVWKQQRIDLVRGWVTRVDTINRRVELEGQTQPLSYDKLLIATGSEPARFGWPGQDIDGVQSFYGLQDLDALYRNVRGARRAVVVGGGLVGIELAEMLHSRNIHVTLLARETAFWNVVIPQEEAEIINRIIEERGLGLVLSTELERIVDDGTGRVTGVITKAGDRIDCQLVGLTTGVVPNTHLARASGVRVGRGVLVDRGMQTEVPGVYAAGDCAEIVTGGEENLIQATWYTGRMQGLAAADAMAGGKVRYDPGVWFNSAKFLDTEYQVYGRVGQALPGEKNLLWVRGDARASVRVVYTDGGVVGFNLLGVRFRHEVCERWIQERRPIDYVLDHLGEANFDSEFSQKHEDVVAALEKQVA
jgi:NADPH-dependent 2,4-dienoyl-CoA reductase/sulfur reductase-like enzyme